MDGVTILAENTWRNCEAVGGAIVLGGSILLLILIIFSVVHTKEYKLLGFLILVFLFGWIGIDEITHESTITRYMVTISDDVSLKEFNEKYNIESINGEIYTVSIKDNVK